MRYRNTTDIKCIFVHFEKPWVHTALLFREQHGVDNTTLPWAGGNLCLAYLRINNRSLIHDVTSDIMDISRVFDHGDDFCLRGLVGFRVDDIGDISGKHPGFSIVTPRSNRFSLHRSDRGKVELSSYLEAPFVTGIPDTPPSFTSLSVALPYCHEDSEWRGNI